MSEVKIRSPDASLLSGLGLAVLGAVFFSGKAIVAKLLYQHGIDAVTLIGGVNATRAPLQAALRDAGVRFDTRIFAGTQHGFHNDSTPRFDEKAAAQAWEATLALFHQALAG